MPAPAPPSTRSTPSPPDGPEARLAALGLVLPAPPRPVAAYIPARRTGRLLFISGQVPMAEGKLLATGAVPSAVGVEEAQRCARQCMLNALAIVRAEAGSLDRVRQVVKLGVFVACDAGFTDHPRVANGASELLVAIFGETGHHARAAVGCPSLPLGAPVEVEVVVEVE
jgi:enamine deaminase RidA (YjgF/YER057c/UK114 family)